MEVIISQGLEGISKKSDINIIIDVLRAFTTSHYAFLGGVDKILLTNEVEEAIRLRQENHILCGEIDGYKIEGFDVGNSPLELMELDLKGKTIIHKTSNGVKATLAFMDAGQVLVSGYSNIIQTAEYVKSLAQNKENLVVHIISSHPTSDDDLACAEYLRALILENENQILQEKEVTERIWHSESAMKFLDESMPEFDVDDLILAVTPKKCNFVMKVGQDQLPCINKYRFAK